MSLSKEQIARYSRQLRLPEVGVPGQRRLAEASVLLIGAGGLGCPAAVYLAAAGVGRLGLVDDQAVELTNLHRQILYAASDVGRAKVESAAETLLARNPEIRVDAIGERLTAANALRLIEAYDVVLDGSDNFPTRYLANDACVIARKPLVHAAAIRFQGQLLTILPGRSACLRCVFPEPPEAGAIPSCQDSGVLGSTVGIMGTLMAHEALKLLLGVGEPLTDRLLVCDGMISRFREVPVRRDAACAVCGEHPLILTPVEDEAACAPCSSDARP
jgi:adenylyltransferase/sulfurtransferase